MRVLLVEDEPDVAETLTWGLTAAGYVVDTADNGVDGLWKATENDYDVIVLDVMLPDTDGFALLPKLRSITDVPVIFVTACARLEDKVTGAMLGAADYVVKPFDMDDLVGRLRRAVAT